jgi:hypothetical protein
MLEDLSSGLSPAAEQVVADAPSEPFWTENLLFTMYDPAADIGFWLHLGTVANEWVMWEDRVLVMLPGDEGVLSLTAYHKTASDRRPGGANLEFRCIEPFKRWKIAFDGFLLHTTNAEMQEGRARDGLKWRMKLNLDVECTQPVWDLHAAAVHATGRGSMREQNWAKEHYEQLYRATGKVTIVRSGPGASAVSGDDVVELDFDGTGWRDHSRGPRGGSNGAPWGGHMIAGCSYPSGKAWGICQYWTPSGVISLEGGYVVLDGELRHAQVVKTPRLRELRLEGEELPVAMKWDGGQLDLTLHVTRSLWTAMRKSLAVGVDLEGEGLMYVLNFGPCEWDGEQAHAYIERSDALNQLAPETHEGTW